MSLEMRPRQTKGDGVRFVVTPAYRKGNQALWLRAFDCRRGTVHEVVTDNNSIAGSTKCVS